MKTNTKYSTYEKMEIVVKDYRGGRYKRQGKKITRIVHTMLDDSGKVVCRVIRHLGIPMFVRPDADGVMTAAILDSDAVDIAKARAAKREAKVNHAA